MSAQWAVPLAPPVLPDGEVHLWRVPLDLADDETALLEAALTPDEHVRARRFRRPRDQRRFIAARGALRSLLGSVLGQEPSRLVFTYGAQGKPMLLRGQTSPALGFNVSHSDELGLIALQWGGDIGVDIEIVRNDFEWEGIAGRFFSDAEIAWLRGLPPPKQHEGFFTLWTRKEAYIKARGEGLWHLLSRFDVSQSPVREAGRATAPSAAWHLVDLDPDKRYKAAVAVQRVLPTLRTWHWTPRI